jgi:plasmid stabilization system protein ParE
VRGFPQLRKLVEGRYLIVYQSYRDRVNVVRFLHGSRDIGTLLTDEWPDPQRDKPDAHG